MKSKGERKRRKKLTNTFTYCMWLKLVSCGTAVFCFLSVSFPSIQIRYLVERQQQQNKKCFLRFFFFTHSTIGLDCRVYIIGVYVLALASQYINEKLKAICLASIQSHENYTNVNCVRVYWCMLCGNKHMIDVIVGFVFFFSFLYFDV